MSDKTTEEAASLRIGDLQSALIDANTTIDQLREENERYRKALYGIKRLNKGWHGENAVHIRNVLTEALTPKQ